MNTFPKFLLVPRRWVPLVVLIISLLVTGASTVYVMSSSEVQDTYRFDNEVNTITSTIESRLNTYIIALLGGRGLFNASNDVTRDEFRTYVSELQLREKYPGIQGFGFSLKLAPEELGDLTVRMHNEGFADFALYPAGKRSEYHSIIYLEPLDIRNKRAIGYDMHTDPIRRAAMDKAAETGKPSMSGKVTLVQENGVKQQSGFLIYIPVYTTKNIPPTNRKKILYGFVYSPFRVNDLFNGIFGNKKNLDVAFSIYDTTKTQKNLLYNSTAINRYTSPYQATRKLKIAEKTWIITFANLPHFEHSSEKRLLSTIMIGGMIISFLLFMISLTQLRARESAEQSALVILNSEQALQESNHRISSILNSITDGFIALDQSWRFTYINKAAARTLERHPEQLLGKSIWEELPGLESTRFGAVYKLAMATNTPKELEDYYAPFKAWLSVRVYPSKTGLSVYFADMTERHRLERQKDDFIGVASHELKTPVTSIKAYIQVLSRRFKKEGDIKSSGLLAKVETQINKLTGLIQDLLDVTKIEAGKLSLQYESIDFNTLIKEVVEEMQITTDRHTIRIEGKTEHLVYTDPERVRQVLTNLISNAINYSPRSDRIIVKTAEEHEAVTVSVQDFGVGIAKDKQDKVFERFFRVSEHTRATYPGLGLGLYISSEIIKRLGGKIWLESTEGKGSTFCFTIPTEKEDIRT